MAKIFADLLAMDVHAQKAGCGLNPKLRAAMDASLRYPTTAASPMPSEADMSGEMPPNVIKLEQKIKDAERKLA
ncbi:hypothetical protein NBRC116594_18170 [Shimia sp. NS0008-38b]|uniref:hypothetical protein n=1 Tax=Shimia sp. NS0008-38b TaxID=3127653 RepID=UPI0031057CB0